VSKTVKLAGVGGERVPAHAANVFILDTRFEFPTGALSARQTRLRGWGNARGFCVVVVGMSGVAVGRRGTSGKQTAERQGGEQRRVEK
jgi:hypothetical protein